MMSAQRYCLIPGMMVVALLMVAGVGANTIPVTSPDGGNGGAGDCTLAEAIQAANSNAAQDACPAGDIEPIVDIITITGAGAAITLTTTVNLNTSITIQGPGVIDGSSSGGIMTVGASAIVILNLVTLQNANGAGGAAILGNGGTLSVNGCNFADNVGSSAGGAINTQGPLFVTTSIFSGNQSGTNGGAINQGGSEDAVIILSSFTTNHADEKGGALFVGNGSAVTVTDSLFAAGIGAKAASSDETDGGGAIYVDNGGTVDVSLSVFDANLSNYGRGGAVFVGLNSVGATFTDCSFDGNATVFADADPLGSDDYNGRGGAIYNQENLAVTRCTFNANIATLSSGGAIANHRRAVAVVTNASFFLNTAGLDGGAIHNADDQFPAGGSSIVELRNCTFDNNTASLHPTASGVGGSLFNNTGDSIPMWNTIVNSSTPDNCSGVMTSNGNNLESGTDCGLTGSGDLQNSNPLLDVPSFNGGPPGVTYLVPPFFMTQDLQLTSPALGSGSAAVCAAQPVDGLDQIGQSRPLGGGPACDMGSFESALVPVELVTFTVE